VQQKLGIKKVGHLGTLDPEAEGVLILLCGRATKLNQQLSGGTKIYQSVFTFGIETDTLDADSKASVIARSDTIPTRKQIQKALDEIMTGSISSLHNTTLDMSTQGVAIEIEVPKYSAVHINGKRAYDLARKGVEFAPPKRVVNIKRFELLSEKETNSPPWRGACEAGGVVFEIECQTGTYIRSLAKLLAQKLGTVAIASKIIRTRVGDFDIKDSKSLDEVTTADLIQVMEKTVD